MRQSILRKGVAAIERRVGELASLLGMEHLLDRRPQGLSGGEIQRVALGRALAMRPGVLLLDEPLSAVDEDTRGEMYDLLLSVRRQTQTTVLHVTHNRSEAERLADRLFELRNSGVHELVNNPRKFQHGPPDHAGSSGEGEFPS